MMILYVDDDIDDYTIFLEMVTAVIPGIQCINAEHGRQALDLLEQLPEYPELIVLDINMPSMDGKACLQAIKSDDRFKDIPVVMYSTGTDPRDKCHCLQLGAVEFVKKPNSMMELEDIFNRIFRPFLDTGRSNAPTSSD